AVGNADTDGGNMEAAAFQHLHGGDEAPALLLAQQAVGGNARILEDDVANMRALLPHLLFRLADVDAWNVARYDEGRNALCARCLRVGARHEREGMGLVGGG